jgi:hypothetical protein
MVTETLKLRADVKQAKDELWELNHRLNDALSSQEAMRKEMEEVKKAAKAQAKEQGVLNQTLIKTANGFKGIGLAMKAAGFGLIMKGVDALSEVMMKNGEVADGVNTIFKTIQIVLTQVSGVFVDMFKRVSDLTGGFDALGKLIGGSLSLGINLLVGGIQGVVLGFQKAQLAWTKFTDPNNVERIGELQSAIDDTNASLEITGERITTAAGDVKDSFVEAVGEVGTLAQGIAEASADAIGKIDVKRAASQAKTIIENEKNYELLALQQQRLVEQFDREAEVQRQIRDDDSKSISDRILANEELGKVLKEQGDAEKATVKARINAINARIKAEGESVELTNELYSLNTEMIAIDAKLTGLQSEQKTNVNALRKEELDLLKTTQETENEVAISRATFGAEQELIEVNRIQKLKDALTLEKQIELQRVQGQIDAATIGTQAYADAQAEKLRLSEDYRQRESDLDKQGLEAEKLLAQQKIAIVSSAFGAVADLLGKNSKAGKAAAIAQAIMNTYLGVTQVLAAPSVVPEPFGTIQKAVSIAGVLATGFKTVKDITAVNPESPSGSMSGSRLSVSSPPSFNVVGSSPTNQLAGMIGEQNKKPQKAYVVSNDVSSAQALDRNIIESASIG